MVAKVDRELAGTEGLSRFASPMDAQIWLRNEECVSGMGQRESNAVVKDAKTRSSKEGCAIGMGQRESNAVVQVAQIRF